MGHPLKYIISHVVYGTTASQALDAAANYVHEVVPTESVYVNVSLRPFEDGDTLTWTATIHWEDF